MIGSSVLSDLKLICNNFVMIGSSDKVGINLLRKTAEKLKFLKDLCEENCTFFKYYLIFWNKQFDYTEPQISLFDYLIKI